MKTHEKLTPAMRRAVKALRKCDPSTLESIAAREESEAKENAKIARRVTRTCGGEAHLPWAWEAECHRAIARLVRALIVTALALACAGCTYGGEPCKEGGPVGMFDRCATPGHVVQRPGVYGLHCACPGSPLLDGGR